MEIIANNHLYLLRLLLGAILAAILLRLYSFWVPVSDGFYYEWLQGDLFREFQPRALLGTFANLLHFGDRGFAFIKITALWVWLTLIIWQITKYTLGSFSFKKIYYLVCLSILFAFGTVTQMSFGPVMFIDVIPYLLILLVYIALASNLVKSTGEYLIIAVLLTSAVAIHEKSIFDIGILSLWLIYKNGFKKTALAVGPGLLLCGFFLFILRNKRLTGESLDTYISTLQRGLDFLGYSFSLVEVLIGLGALGVLYFYLSVCFIFKRSSTADGIQRLALTLTMFIACLAPLTVAWDTNRLVGLIWLPTIILLGEIGADLFSRPDMAKTLFLTALCLLQFSIPPILRFPGAVIAYNAYAKYLYGESAIQMQEPIRQGEALLFKDQAKGSRYLKSGWAGPESWGVWSNQNEAVIQLENLDPKTTYATIHFNTLISDVKSNHLVSIYADDQLIAGQVANHSGSNEINLIFPKRSQKAISLRIKVENLVSPAELGISPNDHRKLGIGLVSIQLK